MGKRGNRDNVHGVVVVDKPIGPTSHDVVARVRRIFGTRQVGHTGTLDPMASGVLVIAIGEGTKLVPYLTVDDKAYVAQVRLGSGTDTLDAQGTEIERVAVPDEVREEIRRLGAAAAARARAANTPSGGDVTSGQANVTGGHMDVFMGHIGAGGAGVGGAADVTGGHLEVAGGHSEVAGGHSEVAGGHSEVAGGHSEVAGGHSEVAGGHSEVAGGHSEVAGGHSEVAGGHIAAALAAERARTMQTPPAFSAIRVGGERAHVIARRGETPDLPPRPIAVRTLELIGARVDGDVYELTLAVDVTKGYFVRSLARDLALALGTVGHLTALRRTRSGTFTIADARKLEALDPSAMLSVTEAARRALPVTVLGEAGVRSVSYGQPVAADAMHEPHAGPSAWVDEAGILVAIGEVLENGEGRVLRGFLHGQPPPSLKPTE